MKHLPLTFAFISLLNTNVKAQKTTIASMEINEIPQMLTLSASNTGLLSATVACLAIIAMLLWILFTSGMLQETQKLRKTH